MCCSNCTVHNIYTNEFASFSQCDSSNCYMLRFENYEADFTVKDFLLFKKRVELIDIHEMIQNTSRQSDFELIMPFRCASFFVLNVQQIVLLKEFLNCAKFHLDLYSILHSKGITYLSDSSPVVA